MISIVHLQKYLYFDAVSITTYFYGIQIFWWYNRIGQPSMEGFGKFPVAIAIAQQTQIHKYTVQKVYTDCIIQYSAIYTVLRNIRVHCRTTAQSVGFISWRQMQAGGWSNWGIIMISTFNNLKTNVLRPYLLIIPSWTLEGSIILRKIIQGPLRHFLSTSYLMTDFGHGTWRDGPKISNYGRLTCVEGLGSPNSFPRPPSWAL